MNLRTYYGKEITKMKKSNKSGAGTDQLYVSKWPFFTQLHTFLSSIVVQRQTTSNIVSTYKRFIYIYIYHV